MNSAKRPKQMTLPGFEEPTIKNLKKTPKPNWGLYESDGYGSFGVSYSLLSKFLVCRERFRLRTVEGLVETQDKPAMEFGTIFHKALELHASGMSLSRIRSHLRKKERTGTYNKSLSEQVTMMLPLYLSNWDEVLKETHYFETEAVFEMPYTCSLGKTVILRGKRDEGFKKSGRLWLQENKTKSQISDEEITQTLCVMLQPMLYLLSFKHDHGNAPLGGIRYNVIRRPGLREKKGETNAAFLSRIEADVKNRPEHYFKMYEIEITDDMLESWRVRYFDPLICQVCVWWESIRANPFNPWVLEDGTPNPNHFIRPFGVFDPMSRGLGDYFGPVVHDNFVGFERNAEVFPELKED